VRDGSLCIYRALPPTDVMASEGMRSEAAGLLSFCCWAPEWTREGASLTLPLFSIARPPPILGSNGGLRPHLDHQEIARKAAAALGTSPIGSR
jgi:hypothetical protein